MIDVLIIILIIMTCCAFVQALYCIFEYIFGRDDDNDDDEYFDYFI